MFTREGDSGYSVTSSGEKIPKDDRIFNAIGATDELSSYIGYVVEDLKLHYVEPLFLIIKFSIL